MKTLNFTVKDLLYIGGNTFTKYIANYEFFSLYIREPLCELKSPVFCLCICCLFFGRDSLQNCSSFWEDKSPKARTQSI